MKKLLALILVTAVLGISAAAHAQQAASIGIYCDGLHSSQCISGVGNYEVTMWIWCLPGADGLFGVEFAMVYPPGLVSGGVERNPIFPFQVGSLDSVDGVATSASVCLKDWTWVFRQTLHVTTSGQMAVRLKGSTIGDLSYEYPIHTSCEYDYPIYDLQVLNYFYINYTGTEQECMMVGTESKSWGAIKSLFR